MRCSVISSSGQVLSHGHLLIEEDGDGDLRLSFRSDRGKYIQGGKIDADGDMTSASQTLFRGFFDAYGISGITLTLKAP